MTRLFLVFGLGGIISSFHAFEERFQGKPFLSARDSRIESLKRYFEKGGVIAVADSNDFPILTYPSKKRVQQQIDETRKLKTMFDQKLSDWKKQYQSAQYMKVKMNAKKLFDGLYWKHAIKRLTDEDYKKDADSVKLPVEMVSSSKYRPMIDMFVNDLEYRKQLSETVKTSVVYKSNTLARHSDELRDLRKNISSVQVAELEKKLLEVNKDLEMFNAMLKWAKD